MRLIVLLFLFLVSLSAKAITVKVIDADGKPVPGSVVELTLDKDIDNPNLPDISEMDQVNRRFVPHILAVHKGTKVTFPNSDSIKHHVYSFSPAKTFELKLYKEAIPTPVEMDNEGVVAMGCNVHDWMSGYIYVAESQFFGQTDENGVYESEPPSKVVSINVWHPRFNETDIKKGQNIEVTEDKIVFQLKQELYPNQDISADEFSDYE